ncbi:hypothetical protein [Jonesia denitrificans]|uniref:hypothetical protein n=1 Tax=Jonesia denitrificans TaxID=43674 RepID=UPI000B516E9F|nr:hypothetical protein [Jonesia denitrificans]
MPQNRSRRPTARYSSARRNPRKRIRGVPWRLAENDLGAQLRALTELRSAVEPVAAMLAANQ